MFFGLCSMLLIEALKAGADLSARLRIWGPLKGLVGGAALVLLTLVCTTPFLG
jgi:H+/Cl- antiporter ClcA